MATYKPDSVKLGEERLLPVDPASECLHSRHLSLSIIGIAESEIPIDVDKLMVPIRDDLMRVNPGFSSIVVRRNEKQWWKQVEVRFADHIFIPTFPPGLSTESYTTHFDEYLTKIGLVPLPENRPLWELHIIKYPTKTAAGTLVFKMSHALGDGFSIMGAVFSMLKRADNSSLPLTFPSAASGGAEEKKSDIWKTGLRLITACAITVYDIVSSMLHTSCFADSPSAVRSGNDVEYMPLETTRIVFSLDDIRRVKTKLSCSVNDIVVGMIFYGIHLYTKTMEQNPSKAQKTGLVVLNTRMLAGYRDLDEMLKQNMWGNQFSFIHIPLPFHSNDQKVDLKSFILEARKIILRNRNSLAVFLNGFLLSLMGRLRGSEMLSKYVHSTLKSCTFTISNLVGPMEKLAIADHPISNIYFTVTGVPQSIVFPVISYMGKLTIGVSVEKGFIDSQLFASCVHEAFKKILEETMK